MSILSSIYLFLLSFILFVMSALRLPFLGCIFWDNEFPLFPCKWRLVSETGRVVPSAAELAGRLRSLGHLSSCHFTLIVSQHGRLSVRWETSGSFPVLVALCSAHGSVPDLGLQKLWKTSTTLRKHNYWLFYTFWCLHLLINLSLEQ